MRDEEDDLLLSQITHAGYCLRRFALVSKEQLWAESSDTVKGRMDIELGCTSGLDFCRNLLHIRPRTNVIFLTAFREYSFDAWSTGACGFLLKPLEVEEVRRQLSSLRYPVGGLL